MTIYEVQVTRFLSETYRVVASSEEEAREKVKDGYGEKRHSQPGDREVGHAEEVET